MVEKRIERRLAAILAADVAGYSRLMGIDEESTHEAFKACRDELVDRKITEHRGRIVKHTGDGVLVEFVSAVDAMRCATEIQRGMAERNNAIPQDRRIEFRIGINVGDIIIDDNDIFGDDVNIAARLEGLAEPGGISVSDRVHQDTSSKLISYLRTWASNSSKILQGWLGCIECVLTEPSNSSELMANSSHGLRQAIRTGHPIVVFVRSKPRTLEYSLVVMRRRLKHSITCAACGKRTLRDCL
jgi:Adenylate and Guanylate cyclase catalytic domain